MAYPTLSPRTAALQAMDITNARLISPFPARIAAEMRSDSPGAGNPKDSRNMPENKAG
jgi:hypothetical protein